VKPVGDDLKLNIGMRLGEFLGGVSVPVPHIGANVLNGGAQTRRYNGPQKLDHA
jgi:hypothetical protein